MTGETSAYRPRVSRETRRLLMTALFAVLTLWILARVRFPDRPVSPNPVAPLLSQLGGFSRFSELASTIEDLQSRVAPLLVTVGLDGGGGATGRTEQLEEPAAGFRVRDDVAIAVLDPEALRGDGPTGTIARDRASGLVIVRVGSVTGAGLPVFWSPQRLDKPQYLAASSPSAGTMSLRPAYVGSLTPADTPAWIGPVWRLPADADLAPGAFLFTDDAELVGVVTRFGNGLAVVPGSTLWAAAENLLRQPHKLPADLGVDVEALTPRLSIASGADTGVIVAWIDPRSVVSGQLRVGDIIQAVDDVEIPTPEHWRVRMARLDAGDTIAIRVWRGGAQRELVVTATPPAASTPPALGLTMRPRPGVGAEVMRVDRGSAADAAGIETGDVISAIGARIAPRVEQVRSSFASARPGEYLIVVVIRGSTHRVVALQR